MKTKFRFYKSLFQIIVLVSVKNSLLAQTGDPGYYNQALNFFLDKNYYQAAQVYEKFLVSEKKSGGRTTAFAVQKKIKGKSNLNMHQEAIYALGECYRLLHDYLTAEKYYKTATAFPTSAFPLTQLWYGVCLKANEKYEEAFQAITKFQETYTEMGPVLIESDRELESLKFIKSELSKNTKNFILDQVANDGNTSAYALRVLDHDTVVFTSIHSENSTSKQSKTTQIVYNNNLYQTVAGENMIAHSTPLGLKDSSLGQNGLACFTPDGSRMYFTRWQKMKGETQASIYWCENGENGWSAPQKLGDPVNIEGYNSTQPFITDDGRYLLFASDRPGGIGNYDLWYAELDSNYEVLNVFNMGPVVNSAGDDEAPYYHSGSRTLIFSTNGRPGMGGYDIFYTKGIFGFPRWETPKNPGVPINSTKDDIYYISTDEHNLWNKGWLSSDRNSGCCLALFSVKENNSLLVRGRIADCKTGKPLAGADVVFYDPLNAYKKLGGLISDSLGHYELEFKNVSVFQINTAKNQYKSGETTLTADLEPGRDTLNTDDICLSPLEINIRAINQELKNLTQQSTLGNFKYKQAKLNSSTNSQLDELAEILKKNPNIRVEIGGYTDGIGGVKYNLKLSQRRVDACVHYLVKKGIDASRLIGKAYGKCCPVEPDKINGKDNPAGRKKNRRVEYKLVE